MTVKAKHYQVSLDGVTHLVVAQTTAGAVRDVIDHLTGDMRKRAVVDLATGEQLYEAGIKNRTIIGSERYKREQDPNQLPLAGIPETAGAVAGEGD